MAVIEYEMVIGPTTLGLNPKHKRVRKAYVIFSKAATATMFVSYATSRAGAYTAEVEVGGTQALTRAKKVLPLALGDPAGGYIYRLKIRGTGEVTVHEIVFAVSGRGSVSV